MLRQNFAYLYCSSCLANIFSSLLVLSQQTSAFAGETNTFCPRRLPQHGEIKYFMQTCATKISISKSGACGKSGLIKDLRETLQTCGGVNM